MENNKKSIQRNRSNQAGFSLTELLVALIIIGILVAMAMPKFGSVISRTKTTEAKLMLNQIHLLQEAFRDEFDRYSMNFGEIGYAPDKLVTDGGSARYGIEIVSATDTSFIARATAVVDIHKNGIMDVWQIDQHKQLRQISN